ncbi:MAG: hypothetical protein ACTSXJ_10000 [Candidatus Baldrarchaeia archaeon]
MDSLSILRGISEKLASILKELLIIANLVGIITILVGAIFWFTGLEIRWGKRMFIGGIALVMLVGYLAS